MFRSPMPGRVGLPVFLAAVVAVGGCSTPRSDAGSDPVVTTARGQLAGRADGDVVRFEGIPYAAPPVGDLRFKAAQVPSSWTGVRDATKPGPRCAQATTPPYSEGAEPIPAGVAEDCLYLNVTVPSGATPDAKRPVLVWVHGGGFSTGSGSDYDPARLVAENDVVVVTINYRLGALGFLGLPGLEGGGTFGIGDQVGALRWVRDEIGAFGGDPAQVTVAGESAGGDSVCALLALPEDQGVLFQRAIVQSASCGRVNVVDTITPGIGTGGDTWRPRELMDAMGVAAAAKLGCPDPTTALECLRGKPVETMLDPQLGYWSPAVGTPMLPEHPAQAIEEGRARAVPVVMGTTSDEGATFTTATYTARPLDAETLRANAEKLAGPRAAELLGIYAPQGTDPLRAWADVITDRAWTCSTLRTARTLSRHQPVRVYQFADSGAPVVQAAVAPTLRGTGATHGSELPSLFTLRPAQPPLDDPQERLAESLRAAWAGFASDGAPQDWPPLRDGDSAKRFTAPTPAPVAVADLRSQHHCDFWDSVDEA